MTNQGKSFQRWQNVFRQIKAHRASLSTPANTRWLSRIMHSPLDGSAAEREAKAMNFGRNVPITAFGTNRIHSNEY